MNRSAWLRVELPFQGWIEAEARQAARPTWYADYR